MKTSVTTTISIVGFLICTDDTVQKGFSRVLGLLVSVGMLGQMLTRGWRRSTKTVEVALFYAALITFAPLLAFLWQQYESLKVDMGVAEASGERPDGVFQNAVVFQKGELALRLLTLGVMLIGDKEIQTFGESGYAACQVLAGCLRLGLVARSHMSGLGDLSLLPQRLEDPAQEAFLLAVVVIGFVVLVRAHGIASFASVVCLLGAVGAGLLKEVALPTGLLKTAVMQAAFVEAMVGLAAIFLGGGMGFMSVIGLGQLLVRQHNLDTLVDAMAKSSA